MIRGIVFMPFLIVFVGVLPLMPLIYATEDNAVEAIFSEIKPKIDGKFTSESEWSDATVTNFESNGNNFYLLTKQDMKFVYLMFDGVDFQTDPKNKDRSVRYQITACFDANNDKKDKRQTGDFCYTYTEYNEFGELIRGEIAPKKFDSEGNSSHLDLPGWAFNSAWGFGSQYDKLGQDDHLMHEMRIPKTLFHSAGDVGFAFEVYFDSAQGDDLVQLVNGVVWPTESNKEDVSSWGTLSLPLVQCKPDLELVFKVSTGEQACVTSDTKQKLVEKGWAKLIGYETRNNYDGIRNHPAVKAFYAKYPNTIEEIRSDHISYVTGSDDGFKVRMKLYFDEKYKLDHIDFHCYFQREHQTDVPESFILRYLKDFECEKRPTLAVVIIPYGSANPENQPRLIPEEITVVLGKNSTVHWTNNDVVPSTLTSDSPGWSTGMIKPGESAYVKFNETGVYQYHGERHPWKKGKVIVLDGLQ